MELERDREHETDAVAEPEPARARPPPRATGRARALRAAAHRASPRARTGAARASVRVGEIAGAVRPRHRGRREVVLAPRRSEVGVERVVAAELEREMRAVDDVAAAWTSGSRTRARCGRTSPSRPRPPRAAAHRDPRTPTRQTAVGDRRRARGALAGVRRASRLCSIGRRGKPFMGTDPRLLRDQCARTLTQTDFTGLGHARGGQGPRQLRVAATGARSSSPTASAASTSWSARCRSRARC